MLKYTDTLVSFQEVPDEISLCINISNCPCFCKECHSPWLAEDIGEKLTPDKLLELIKTNKGISCVCFMGGDSNHSDINGLAAVIKYNTNLKVAWYSGRQYIPDNLTLNYFDYIKIGPYIPKLGGLDSKTTNQIMYKVIDNQLTNITYKFWKNDSEDCL